MRKKSHLALTHFLLRDTHTRWLKQHKNSFYIGSILPDCTPSFITRKHSVEGSYDVLKKEIRKITDEYDISKGTGMYFWRHLGVVTHYLADFFTYPHNDIFDGTLREHCSYEKNLKLELKQYVSALPSTQVNEKQDIDSADQLFALIERLHARYLEVVKEVRIDCEHIVEICRQVVTAILQYIDTQRRRFYGYAV